jgi:hypothetical protein
MKRIFAISVLFTLLSTFSFAETIIIEGKYQNRNVYVVNSIASSGVGYCAYRVTVNGDVSTDEVSSSAFEIDLAQYNFAVGDEITITIEHKGGCKPKILNPGVLMPQPTFNTEGIEIDGTGLLKWKTSNEKGVLPFSVQQYKWSKWVTVGEVQGKGTESTNEYTFQTTLTSGKNKFRVMQKNFQGDVKKSRSVETTSSKAPLTFEYDRRTKKVTFSADTGFEIFDAFGQIKKRGFSSVIDASNMKRGQYYLSFDSMTELLQIR